MNWFVVVPAAWFGIALALGLLVGRCLSVEGIARPTAAAPAGDAAAPTATDHSSASDSDAHGPLTADPALARAA